MNEAEDWMRENIKGQWELQFLGMSEEIDDFKKTKSYIFHVRFNFGRSEDMKRFKEEYIEGKPPAPKAKAPAPKKKGLLWPSLRLRRGTGQVVTAAFPTKISIILYKIYLHLRLTPVTYAGKYI